MRLHQRVGWNGTLGIDRKHEAVVAMFEELNWLWLAQTKGEA
jgi:hypothetical protein